MVQSKSIIYSAYIYGDFNISEFTEKKLLIVLAKSKFFRSNQTLRKLSVLPTTHGIRSAAYGSSGLRHIPVI
jgi:hypothetical protein